MPPRGSRNGAASCIDCLAWGVLGARRCMACGVWRHNYPGEQLCSGCGRVLAVKDRGWHDGRVTLSERIEADRRERRVLTRVSRAAWRLDQAEPERTLTTPPTRHVSP